MARAGHQNTCLARTVTELSVRVEDVREIILEYCVAELFWSEPHSHSKVILSDADFVRGMALVVSEFLTENTSIEIDIQSLLSLIPADDLTLISLTYAIMKLETV